MEKVKNAINWFEIPVTNFEKAKLFYSKIFDYDMPVQEMDSNMMGFLLSDQESQGIGGAIVQGKGYEPSQNGVLVYLNGGYDLNVVLDRVEDAGGKIVLPKTLITKEIGYYAVFTDVEGNRLAIHSFN